MEWIKLLESGEIEQTRGRLKRQIGRRTEYCCIGVLCNVLEDNQVGEWDHEQFLFEESLTDSYIYDINRRISGALGLENEWMDRYIHMNDDKQQSFEEIAAQIRSDTKL